ncbi:hypothetical protein BJY52DRAFT_1225659 [Lactarius psammicola]|nr:hypothetical protein BJY52DRAFT_1225659 [Lactarius psammicola]
MRAGQLRVGQNNLSRSSHTSLLRTVLKDLVESTRVWFSIDRAGSRVSPRDAVSNTLSISEPVGVSLSACDTASPGREDLAGFDLADTRVVVVLDELVDDLLEYVLVTFDSAIAFISVLSSMVAGQETAFVNEVPTFSALLNVFSFTDPIYREAPKTRFTSYHNYVQITPRVIGSALSLCNLLQRVGRRDPGYFSYGAPGTNDDMNLSTK